MAKVRVKKASDAEVRAVVNQIIKIVEPLTTKERRRLLAGVCVLHGIDVGEIETDVHVVKTR